MGWDWMVSTWMYRSGRKGPAPACATSTRLMHSMFKLASPVSCCDAAKKNLLSGLKMRRGSDESITLLDPKNNCGVGARA